MKITNITTNVTKTWEKGFATDKESRNPWCIEVEVGCFWWQVGSHYPMSYDNSSMLFTWLTLRIFHFHNTEDTPIVTPAFRSPHVTVVFALMVISLSIKAEKNKTKTFFFYWLCWSPGNVSWGSSGCHRAQWKLQQGLIMWLRYKHIFILQQRPAYSTYFT